MGLKLNKRWDTSLITLIIILTFWGLINFYSASSFLSQKNYGSQYQLLLQFLVKNTLLGFLAFFIFATLPWRTLKKLSLPLFVLALLALLLAFHPAFRSPDQTTARWFQFKFISFQSSELVKLTLLLWLSFLVPQLQRTFTSPQQRSLTVIFIVGLVSVLIYFQPALSNLLIIWASILAGYLALRPRLKELVPFIALILIFIVLSPLWSYRLQRLVAHFERGYSQSEVNFQKEQTKLAVGSGGILGQGLGKSKVKLIGVPLLITDSIFSIYAEETGFVGSLFLILLFLGLVLVISNRTAVISAPEKRFFGYGLATWICAQAFIHIASNIGLIPTTGVPLPFFSYGPSAQVALMAALGVVGSFQSS